MAIFLSSSSRASARWVRSLPVLLAGLVAVTAVASAQPAAAPAGSEPAAAAPAAAAPAVAAPAGGEPAAAAPAAAAPAGGEPAAPAVAAPPAETAAASEGGTPLALKHSCMAAINADQQWTDELREAVQKRMTYDAHQAEAVLIATNKRHVVMAYAALWLAAIGFLVLQWRKQKVLREQLEALRRDLDAAVKGTST